MIRTQNETGIDVQRPHPLKRINSNGERRRQLEQETVAESNESQVSAEISLADTGFDGLDLLSFVCQQCSIVGGGTMSKSSTCNKMLNS